MELKVPITSDIRILALNELRENEYRRDLHMYKYFIVEHIPLWITMFNNLI